MRKEFALLGAMLAIATGCASPPEPSPSYAHTIEIVQTAVKHNGFSATLPSDAKLDEPHALDFYVKLALERNPEIVAARRRVSAQEQVVPQVTALQDPMLTDTFWPISSNSPQTAAGRAPMMLSLSQQFPWMGKLQVRGEVAFR